MNVLCKQVHLLGWDPGNDPVCNLDRNPNNFAPCKQGISYASFSFSDLNMSHLNPPKNIFGTLYIFVSFVSKRSLLTYWVKNRESDPNPKFCSSTDLHVHKKKFVH